MSDLIRRKEAIDALKKIMFTHLFECGEYIGENIREFSIMNAEKALDVIENLPSAEPDNQVHLCDSCHYGYPVCPAMNNEVIYGNGKGHDNICACAKYIPSAEPVRKAKVMRHKYWLGVSLNVVGEQTIGYEWIYENCKKMVLDGDDYCSHCGARLEWE